jgi:hypothetical protein
MSLAFAIAGVGCPCARAAVNASPELRWWLFSNFGASKICPEMLKRGIPLRLREFGPPSIGRFYPMQCHVQVDDARKSMTMTTTGTGYVMLPFTRRVGFSVFMAVEYLPDFRLEEDSTYVWGKFSRFTSQPMMQIMGVENPVVNLATQTPIGNVATIIGNGLVASEIGRGFTVVRQEDGDDFTLGHLEPPEKPKRQFKTGAPGHVVLESNLTSIYTRSRDFTGPFEVPSPNMSIFLRAKVEGAPVTYAIVERSVGETWRRQYETAQPLSPPPGAVIGQGTLPLGETAMGFPVNPAHYYIVLENMAAPPLLGPAIPAIGETISHVTYSVEIGERK